MRHIFICGLSGSTTFFTLSQKRHDFRVKEVLEHKVHVFSPQLLSETFLILPRILRGIINKY
jgi:hypothetical protein